MSKPVHIARAGAVRIPVARNGPGRYLIRWREYAGAQVRRENFRDRPAAMARADELALALANSQADVVTLSSADRDHYRRAILTLAPLGVPLPVAIDEYAAAKKIAGPQSLIDCARLATAQAAAPACPPTAQIVAELLADAADNRRAAKYRGELHRDLDRFASRFPDLGAVSHAGLKSYLAALTVAKGPRKGEPVSLRRRDNVRDAIVLLYRFARRPRDGRQNGYLPDRLSIAEQVPRLATGGEVTTYSAAEVDAILSHLAAHDSLWLPWAAIAAFAGLRTSEIFRLDWSRIDWGTRTIAVPASVARKVRISRRAPLLDNLAQWLAPWRHATGPVIAFTGFMQSGHDRALARLRAALSWDGWKTNALRHSFGSHRLAIVQNIQQVSLEMGNSPGQIREHYNDSTTESAARSYFGITPAAPANILPIRAAQ